MLAPDSNGLRVLLNLGYGSESKRYEKAYETVREATAAEERREIDRRISLERSLRRHDQNMCRRNRPERERCPLSRERVHYEERFGSRRADP